MGDGGVRFCKGVDAVDDRADMARFNQVGDLLQLLAIRLHEQKVERHSACLRLFDGPARQKPEDQLQIPRQPEGRRKCRGGRAGDRHQPAAGPQNVQRLVQGLRVLTVQDHVIVAQHRLEILRLVVDHEVSPKRRQPIGICGTGGGGDIGPDMLGQLDCDGPHPARACLNEHLLPCPQLCHLDQRLPGGQRDKGNRGCLLHAKRSGLWGQ